MEKNPTIVNFPVKSIEFGDLLSEEVNLAIFYWDFYQMICWYFFIRLFIDWWLDFFLIDWWIYGMMEHHFFDTKELIDRMIDWLIEWLNYWITDWLTGWMTDWLTECVIDCVIDWLIAWLIDWLNDWLTDWLIDLRNFWLIARIVQNMEQADWLVDWLNDLLIDCKNRTKYLIDLINALLMNG